MRSLSTDRPDGTLPRVFGGVTLALAGWLVVASAGRAAEPNAAEARPSFEKLLELNAGEIFGTSVKFDEKKERISLHFTKPEQFQKGFVGSGIAPPSALKGINARALKRQGDKKGDVPNVVAAGVDRGLWTSNFMLAGDFTVSFKIGVPMIGKSGAAFNLVYRSEDRKDIAQIAFFQAGLLKTRGSAAVRAVTPHREFQGSPARWFDRKATEIPVALKVSDGKMSVHLNEKEMLLLEGADNLAPGKLTFQFNEIYFALSDLKISTALDRQWCEQRLATLEANNLLKVKEEPSDVPKEKLRDAQKRKSDSLRDKEAEIDL